MIKLIPEWTMDTEEFWQSLKRRNLFFIKLRFVAVIMLLAFNYVYETIVNIELSQFQHNAIGIITFFLLLYNISLFSIRKKLKNKRGSFNSLHLSLLQIVLDLAVLTLLINFTGGIESPLYLFYIFHLIIGSLILPGYVIYSIAFVTILAMSSISFLQYFQYIPHYCIEGAYETHLYSNPVYIITTLVFFSLMLLISVFLTNRIVNQLYSQERRLVEALNEINESEVKKQKYIMGVVHEIKSPIAATKSLLSLIVDGFVGEISSQVKQKLNRAIIRSTESLGLINNILRISRLRLLDERTSENLNVYEIIKSVLDENKENFEAKKIKLKFIDIINLNKITLIKGDGFLLRLAISNLVSNAIKYTDTKGKISIKYKEKGKFVVVTICDNGIGVPESELNKIFENYYRAKNISDEKQEGVGVGLSLVKEIIKQHRGEIDVMSPSPLGNTKNPGTCFTIKLPYTLKDISDSSEELLTVKGGV